MEVVRKYVDEKQLRSLVSLPETFRGKKLEILVFPAQGKSALPKGDSLSCLVDSLIGIIPDAGKELEEYKAERLQKYETAD